MGFFSNIGKFLKKSVKSLSNPVKYLGDLGSALFGGNAFADYDGNLGVLGNLGGNMQDFWKDYTGQTIAEKNLDFQREQFDYQKMLNQQQMQREDTAYQRKVADMTKAGFNPILATGGSGSPSAPLHAGPAPQLGDYSGGIREGLGGMSDLVMKVLTMRKDFAVKDAEISKLYADRDKAEAEATGVKIDNQTRGETNYLRNLGMRLDNQFVESSMPYKIKELTNHLDLQELKKIHMEFENELSRIGVDLAELDRTYKELGITDLRKKIELDTLALLHKTQEYEAYKFARNFYEGRWNVPTGFNLSSLVGAIVGAGSGFGRIIKEFLSSAFEKEGSHYHGVSREFDSPSPTDFVPLDFDEPGVFGPSVSDVIKSFVNSYRRPADGVRRNQYSIMFR